MTKDEKPNNGSPILNSLRGVPQKLNVYIGNTKMMMHILSKLSEFYKNTVESLED